MKVNTCKTLFHPQPATMVKIKNERIMKLIENTEFGGERPLFASHNIHLDNVTIREGESAIKECSNIVATNCRFEGNYPFWHVHGFTIDNCYLP